jgi:carbonic anhydrase
MHQLMASPEGKAAVEEGRGKLVGAVYEIATGRVRFLH